MQYTRESAIERLLKNYEPYYDIHRMINGDQSLITARCDFFEHSGQYVISKKAELWSADNEEFLYLVNVPHLTLDLFESLKNEIHEDGMGRIHVGPGHMASYITAVFVCDTCDEDARKALKKCRIYKSFHFSLHGPQEFSASSSYPSFIPPFFVYKFLTFTIITEKRRSVNYVPSKNLQNHRFLIILYRLNQSRPHRALYPLTRILLRTPQKYKEQSPSVPRARRFQSLYLRLNDCGALP